jgi:hypothetical protein
MVQEHESLRKRLFSMQWIELAQYKSKLQDYDYMMMNRHNIQECLGQQNNNYLLRNSLYHAVG